MLVGALSGLKSLVGALGAPGISAPGSLGPFGAALVRCPHLGYYVVVQLGGPHFQYQVLVQIDVDVHQGVFPGTNFQAAEGGHNIMPIIENNRIEGVSLGFNLVYVSIVCSQVNDNIWVLQLSDQFQKIALRTSFSSRKEKTGCIIKTPVVFVVRENLILVTVIFLVLFYVSFPFTIPPLPNTYLPLI